MAERAATTMKERILKLMGGCVVVVVVDDMEEELSIGTRRCDTIEM